MKRKLIIPPQSSTFEIENIFCKALMRICCENDLMDEVIKILRNRIKL